MGPVTVGRKRLTRFVIIHITTAMASDFIQPISYKLPRAMSQAIPPIVDAKNPAAVTKSAISLTVLFCFAL